MLEIVPIKQKEAKAFIEQTHRHHKAPAGSIFQIACAKDGVIVGVAMVGRPTSRHLDSGCSILYSACWRVAKNLGYKRLITYILEDENGASLKASNWREVGARGGGSWSRANRPRVDKHPTQKKILFDIE